MTGAKETGQSLELKLQKRLTHALKIIHSLKHIHEHTHAHQNIFFYTLSEIVPSETIA